MGRKVLSDQQIIIAIQMGQEHQALKQIYGQYYGSVENLVLQHKGRISDAKDIFQEAIIIFYKNALNPDFQLTSTIKTYLYAVAKNLWYKQIRKKGKLPTNTLSEEVESTLADIPTERVEAKNEEEQVMMATVEEMGNPCKTLLYQYYFYKKSMEEIAQTMNYTSAANARNQKYKCMKRLQKLVLQRLKNINN